MSHDEHAAPRAEKPPAARENAAAPRRTRRIDCGADDAAHGRHAAHGHARGRRETADARADEATTRHRAD